MLKQNNITYCFIPYMEFDKAVLDATEKLKYLDESKFTASLKEGHRNYFIDNKLVIDSAGHPNTIGYNRLAKMTLEILRKTVLIWQKMKINYIKFGKFNFFSYICSTNTYILI